MIALLLAARLAGCALAGGGALPPRSALVLPDGVEAGWVIPPSDKRKEGAEVSLSVDPDGEVWLTAGHRALFVPQENALFRADRPFQQVLWLGRTQLVRSYSALGRFRAREHDERGLPQVSFQPKAMIPLSPWRMAPAGDKNVYVAGFNPRKKVWQLALLGPGEDSSRPLRVLSEGKVQIADAAGDGKRTFFASGRAIWELGEGGKPKLVFMHPKAQIRRLLYLPGGALVYATDESVGVAGLEKRFDFIRAARCQIAADGDDVYVMLGPLSGGVLRVRGLSRAAGL